MANKIKTLVEEKRIWKKLPFRVILSMASVIYLFNMIEFMGQMLTFHLFFGLTHVECTNTL